MAHCDCNRCKLPARVAVASGPRYLSLRCGPHAVVAARQLLAAGRTVRIDPLVSTKVNDNVTSDGRFFGSDVDATAHQATLDRLAIDYAMRVDRAARASEALGAGESVA